MASCFWTKKQDKANAAHIVRCWNSHYELLDIVKAVQKRFNAGQSFGRSDNNRALVDQVIESTGGVLE